MKATTERSAWTAVAVLSILAMTSALLAHAYVGFFGRFLSDDYCTAGLLGSRGFVGAQKFWFVQWSGRFSFVFAIGIAHLVGPKIVPFLPAAVLLSWLAALSWGISLAMRAVYRRRLTLLSVLLAEIIIIATLATAGSVYQSLYWQTGVITYVLPLVFAATYIALLARIALRGDRPSHGELLLGGCVTFIAAGFSESFAVLQWVALLVAFFLSVAPVGFFGKEKRTYLLFGLIGATLGASLLVLAPGNEARMGEAAAVGVFSPPARNWLAFVKTSVRFGLDSILIASRPWLFVTTVAFFPAVLAYAVPREDRELAETNFSLPVISKRLAGCAIIGIALIACSFAPAAYVTSYLQASYYPPGRLFIIPQFVFYCFVCLGGFWVGMSARSLELTLTLRSSNSRRPTYVFYVFCVASLLTLWAAGSSARMTWAIAPTVRRFAVAWDEQDHKIQSAKLMGLRSVRVEGLPATSQSARVRRYFGLRLIDSASDNWVNRCAADYYGLDSIVVE